MMGPFELVLSKLDGVRGSGLSRKALCPAHDDHRPSLGVSQGDDGRALLFCQSGCQAEDVVAAVGLTMADLFPDRPPASTNGHARGSGARSRVVSSKTYPIRDPNGNLVANHIRKDLADGGKIVAWAQPDGTPGLNGTKLRDLPLYGVEKLPESPQEPVIVVEGEKAAEALWTLQRAAVGTYGASAIPSRQALEPLRGRPVFLWPDNDDPGRKHMASIAAALADVGVEPRWVEWPEAPPKGDAADWMGDKDGLGALIDSAGLAPPRGFESSEGDSGASEFAGEYEWDDPVPFDSVGLEPFPLASLPRGLAEWARATATFSQTPEDVAGVVALTVLGAASAGGWEFEVRRGWRETMCLFTATAQPSGSRKSPVWGAAVRPLMERERDEREAGEIAIAKAVTEYEIAEDALRDAKKAASRATGPDRDQLIQEAVRMAEELDEKEVPHAPRLVAEDITPEGLVKMLAQQGGRIAILSAEAGAFDQMAGKYSRDGTGSLDVYLKGYSGESLCSDRVGRATDSVERPVLTIGLAFQPEVLEKLSSRSGFRGRGLLARFLFSVPRDFVGFREINPPEVPESVTAAYGQLIQAILETARGRRGGPETLVPSPGAMRVLSDYRAVVERRMRPGEDLWDLRDWASKLPGNVCRIAALLHIAEHAHAGVPLQVSEDAMRKATDLGDYFTTHALRAFDMMRVDTEVAGARRLWRVIENMDDATFTKRELFQRARGSWLTRTADMDSPLGWLEASGYLRQRPQEKRPGRPSVVFEVNPLVRNSGA